MSESNRDRKRMRGVDDAQSLEESLSGTAYDLTDQEQQELPSQTRLVGACHRANTEFLHSQFTDLPQQQPANSQLLPPAPANIQFPHSLPTHQPLHLPPQLSMQQPQPQHRSANTQFLHSLSTHREQRPGGTTPSSNIQFLHPLPTPRPQQLQQQLLMQQAQQAQQAQQQQQQSANTQFLHSSLTYHPPQQLPQQLLMQQAQQAQRARRAQQAQQQQQQSANTQFLHSSLTYHPPQQPENIQQRRANIQFLHSLSPPRERRVGKSHRANTQFLHSSFTHYPPQQSEDIQQQQQANKQLSQQLPMPQLQPPLPEHPDSYQPAPSFVYPYLTNTKSSIRLMQIDPGPSSDTSGNIYCSLMSWDPWISEVKYYCLSYCWGATSCDRRIFVRTPDTMYQSMDITRNLHSALQDLGAASQSTFYWIDAICIDQTDNAERGEQVSRMKDIYDRASGVVISLGSSTARLSAAVDIVMQISNQFEKDTRISPDMIVGPSGLNLTAKDTEKLESYTNYAYQEVAHFFSLPWFRRVWVLQEAFSQTTISVRLGTRTLPWGSVILAAFWQAQLARSHTVALPSYGEADGDGTRQYFPELWLSLLHTRMPRGLSMIELTSRARDFQATDPRDKVFSLLGLANDMGPLETRPFGLVPDYTQSTTEVYANFARAIILKTRKLDVLSLVNTFDGRRNSSQHLISWMPNLDASVATIRGLGFPNKYDASFSTEVHVELTGRKSDRMHVLTLAGFRIDSIRFTTKNVMLFSRNLRLYSGDNLDAVAELWRAYGKPSVYGGISEKECLQQHVELITATGIALPTEFPARPLGRVVPVRKFPSVLNDFAAYWARIDPDFLDFGAATRTELQALVKQGDADQFGVIAGKACHERKFFTTLNGRMGLCPRDTEVGDAIVILFGGNVPYVLRPTVDKEWRFIGECYTNGVMFGETWNSGERGKEEAFHIV